MTEKRPTSIKKPDLKINNPSLMEYHLMKSNLGSMIKKLRSPNFLERSPIAVGFKHRHFDVHCHLSAKFRVHSVRHSNHSIVENPVRLMSQYMDADFETRKKISIVSDQLPYLSEFF